MCAVFGLFALLVPTAASAQCDIECVRLIDPETHEFTEYGCTSGEHDDCTPEGNTCWHILCTAPVALLDDTGQATMTMQFCPAVNDGEVTLTDIFLEADPVPRAIVDDAESTEELDR